MTDSPPPEVRFKDLCLDAAATEPLARFWAAVLGARPEVLADGEVRLHGEPGSLTWVDAVPEPRTGKTRVHLDLWLPAPDPAPLLALGATLVREPDDEIHWWVLADPEGNAFCAMPPPPADWGLPPITAPTPFELVVDARDAGAQAAWWAARTGGRAATRDGVAWHWIEGAAGLPWRYWVFNPVPEPKTVKNRMHWDVVLRDADPGALLAAGATLLREPTGTTRWWVLADPEGNEFCAFPPAAPAPA